MINIQSAQRMAFQALPQKSGPVRFAARIALATAILLGVACSSAPQTRAPDGSAEELYNNAKRSLNQGDFQSAISFFESLGARFPFGTYTQQAQLDIAYAYFRQDQYDAAVDSADRFIKLYPRSDNIDYAFYIKGISHYSRGGSAMERIFPRDLARVNQNWLRSSFAEFDNLVRRFPDSEYASDSLARMRHLRNEMARHELITAEFYFERGAMVAVINRMTHLLEHFDGSIHVPDALALLARAYDSLGQDDLKSDTLRVLSLTEPDHPAVKS